MKTFLKGLLKKIWAPLVVGVVAILWVINSNHQSTEIQRLENENYAFQVKIRKNNTDLVIQKEKILSLEQFNKQNDTLIKELKKAGVKHVYTIIKLETENRRLKLELSYKPDTIIDTLVIRDGSDLKTYLRVPMPFEYPGKIIKDPWLYCSGVVKTTGVTIDSLIVYSKPSIVLGWETKFFKKSTPIIVYQDQNPYSVVMNMDNAVVQVKPRFYKTPWWHRMEGALLLFGVAEGINALTK